MTNNKLHIQKKDILYFVLFLVFVFIILFYFPRFFTEHYTSGETLGSIIGVSDDNKVLEEESGFIPNYVETPDQVKGIYMTSWVAGTPSLRNGLVKLIDETEINTLVIDIKDYTGKIVFPIEDPKLKSYGAEEVRVRDMREFIETLHSKGVYVVGRVAVFQDPYFVKIRPDLAVKNKAGTEVWKDRKGLSWIDPASREYWDYIVLLAEESRKVGFDEINFDYIRFPSDGNMQDISYPWSSTTPKTVVMEGFFKYLNQKLVENSISTDRLKISADLFGMVTTAKDDMGIGQLLEIALPYFDYIMPMVYPSHYPPTYQGYKNPAQYPYEIIKYDMSSAITRAKLASTSPDKLRPWLQDFNLGAVYDATKVRAQIQATYDVGLDSWILWSPSNKYTKGALEQNQN